MSALAAVSESRPRRVVISQPMLFPWVGMLEQIHLADAFVHYDDVQFSKGSFTNRVQIKTAKGTEWMTVPLAGRRLDQRICDVKTNESLPWRDRHLKMLAAAYEGAPFREDALGLLEEVYSLQTDELCQISIASMTVLADYFGLQDLSRAPRSSILGLVGKGSSRVLSVVQHVAGAVYVTGHGARNYLDHQAFERSGIQVEYVRYSMSPYRQLHGEFTPYVSALDLVANIGRAGGPYIGSATVPWKEFLSQ